MISATKAMFAEFGNTNSAKQDNVPDVDSFSEESGHIAVPFDKLRRHPGIMSFVRMFIIFMD
jgi:hypothetical protein